MGLATYRKKRNFKVTAEPAGKKPPRKSKAPRFVIQKHDASRLHYDFRLEVDGVLKSWAVPKGLPWAQAEKHLAVEVEDHPIDYADFEGIIPKGQYGGGTVMVWDRGAYEVTRADSPAAGIKAGKFHIILHGEKVQGEWALFRIRSDEKNQWLLMKVEGGMKPISKKLDDESVKTGRTMKQIAAAADAEWQSHRVDSNTSATSVFKTRIQAAVKKKDESEGATPAPRANGVGIAGRGSKKAGRNAGRARSAAAAKTLPKNLPKARPRFIEPMKARLMEKLPKEGDWSYELKFDGIRVLAVKNGKSLRLISRNEKELNKRFPEIADACRKIAADEFIIDGEVVALDSEGRSSFQLLQRGELDAQDAPLAFYGFDLLQLNGYSLLSLELRQRKGLLAQILPTNEVTRFSADLGNDGKSLLAEVKRRGLEGLIGKRPHSIYEPGRRSGAWIKIKCVTEQEFVIGGFTPPAGARKHFGALLVGYYADRDLFRFAGKVGTGFNAKMLSSLHKKLLREKREQCPFVDLPSKQNGQWVQGITPGEMRKCTWVNPKFVCQVKFAEWTRDLKLRQPVFLGLREDKDAPEVKRESAS
jgi:bifunctional non-homologous end joining protein LigD